MGRHTVGSVVVFAKRLVLEARADGPSAVRAADQPARPRRSELGVVGEDEGVNAPRPNARDAAGNRLNVNADSVAGHVAAALKAEKLVLVSDTHGIRTSDDAESLATHVTRSQIDELVASGVITAGMLPKVEASITALE